ncbi:alpha-ribazole phosphatase [Alteromonadaceae bacterium 2753L.S.0a.02]|nr:alpha-ribazole phosphatase [Alteromonadaceae bacterium 2753L.S.0a.02]
MIASDDFQVTQLDLLRHGQCEGGDIFRGSTDVRLTPEGFANMQASCDAMNTPWQAIISSPLKRCCEFATHLSQSLNLPLKTDLRLQEINYGEWEGVQRDLIWQTRHDEILAWMHNPAENTPPGGETLQAVATRLNALLSDILRDYHKQNILLVAHGGVIRIVLSELLGMPLDRAQSFEVPFASVTRIKIYDKAESRLVKLAAHNFIGDKA